MVFSFLDFLFLSTHQITTPTTTTRTTTPVEAPITIGKVWSEIKQKRGRVCIASHISCSVGCVTVTHCKNCTKKQSYLCISNRHLYDKIQCHHVSQKIINNFSTQPLWDKTIKGNERKADKTKLLPVSVSKCHWEFFYRMQVQIQGNNPSSRSTVPNSYTWGRRTGVL